MALPKGETLPLFPMSVRWSSEDWTTSEGKTKDVILAGLPKGATSACGEYVCIEGNQQLNGNFYYKPFADSVCGSHSYPQMNKCLLPDERFVQVQAYQVIDEVLRAIGRQIDIKAILGNETDGTMRKVKAHIAGTSDFNAWYSRYSNSMTFGTGKGIWYLGGCIDIVLHEFGHYVLDHINPHMLSWNGEGGAIHEGFADFVAASIANDPEIGEDFVLAYEYYKKSAQPFELSSSEDAPIVPDKNNGLRTVANDLTLKQAGTEVHDRGRAYGGFFWSLRNRLIEYSPHYFGANNGKDASTAILKLALHHCTSYQVNSPQPADFVEAMLRATDRLFANEYTTVPYFRNAKVNAEAVKEMIRKEAIKRGFITETTFENVKERMSYGQKFKTADEVIKHHKTYYGAEFASPQTTSGPFSNNEKQLFYQQTKQVEIHGKKEAVELIGHGFYERDENVNGQLAKTYITGGIRNLRTEDIDSTVNITDKQALEILLEVTEAMHEKLRQMNEKTKQGFSESTMDPKMLESLPYSDFALMDANETIIRSLIETLSGQGEPFTRKFSVLPNTNDICYEFRTEMASVFVDAKTGQIKIKSNIFIDNWMLAS